MPVKKEISGISGLSTVILLLASLLLPAAPASADTAAWSEEAIPSMTDRVLGPPGIDIRDFAIAADGGTIYAVPGDSISDRVVYKSTTAGASWTTLDIDITADLVAVAPDDTDTIAIANSSTREVYITINGGLNWNTLGIPQESGGAPASAIYDMALSRASNEKRYIAVAGKEAGDVANAWYLNTTGVISAWKQTRTLSGFSSASEVAAVAFSPNFPSDEVMVAVSKDGSGYVKLQIFSVNAEKWNGSANFGGYPVTIVNNSGITGLASASIAMSPSYLADESDSRDLFVGLTASGYAAASGIYRLRNTTNEALKTGAQIHSVAYNGASLVAGGYNDTTIYRSNNPMATTPTFSTVSALKRPGGENKVKVAWAGSDVVAGTSGNESAFAVSRNSGTSFNDISLIDTAITNARDVAVSGDGNKVYLVTDDGHDLSLWRRASTWERILSQHGTTDYIVRTSPGNAEVIYLAKKDGTTVYYSKNGGEAEWFTRTCRTNVHDLAVESDQVVYALDSTGSVSQTVNAGFTWGTAVATGLGSGATIVSVSTNTLLVGSQDGYMAYSTNGISSWTRISKVLESGAGKVQVIADVNYASNKIIYAASDTSGQNIKKWQIGSSTEWSDIFRSTVPGGIYGLAMDDTTLYALEFNTGNGQSTLWRCLTPTTVTGTSANWSSSATKTTTDADDAEVHLNAAPRALKVSSGKLWAVKTNGTNKLYSFTDIAIEVTLMKPDSGFVNRVSAINGLAQDMVFRWERPSEATEYELQVAQDEDFINIVATITIQSTESSVVAVVGPHQTGDFKVNFLAGTAYYWRVRTTQPLYSLYSTTRSFIVEPLMATVPDLLTPANGSTDVSRKPSFSWEPVSGASEYEFILSTNATMASLIIKTRVSNAAFTLTEELDYGHTYFWKVRATVPTASDWSALANFTIKEAPAEPVPPVVVQQVPAPVINMPEPPPPSAVTFAPTPPAPSPTVPIYILAAIIVASVLLLVVVALILRPAIARPVRVAEGFGGWGKLRGGLANYFQYVKPFRTPGRARTRIAGISEAEGGQPIAFAAKSFLWMTTSKEKEPGKRLLSADEERSLGGILAARIKALAGDNLLYHKFPEDAALFLQLWSQYGSRDETNRYLAKSFQSRPENAIEFLKCYLTTPGGPKAGVSRRTSFGRTQYTSVARAVDPDKVYEALARIYGPELERPEGEKPDVSPDKALALQFARIHHLIKSETKKTGKTVPPDKTGTVKTDAR